MKGLLFLLPAALLAQEDHSRHDHGAAGLGTVSFPTSCSAAAQPVFTRAVALLHSFGYEESRNTFREAAKADPTCAMAYWGEAMTLHHPIWVPQLPEEVKQGAAAFERARATPAKTERERAYIEALATFYKDWQTLDYRTRSTAYEQAMAKVQAKYPKDDEAAIFRAELLVSLGIMDPADKNYTRQKQASEILNGVLPRHPNHPGVAHYMIHAYDYPALASLALPAARAYAKIAPDAPHALHMPSHIFTRLGLWDDSIQSNLASSAAAKRRAERMRGGGGAFDQLHAMDYLVYAYLQEGRDTSARKVLEEMAALTRVDDPQFAAAYSFGAAPLRYPLERHDWKAAAKVTLGPAWFPWKNFRNVEALGLYGQAIGAARAGDAAAARAAIAKLEAIRNALPPARDYDWSGAIGAQLDAASGLLAFAEGRKQEGLSQLRQAADHEDSIDKHAVTPGAIVPARELLADLLLETRDLPRAAGEYEAVLKISPRRYNSVAGAARVYQLAGDRAKAAKYYGELLKLCEHAEVERPELIEARAFLKTK